MGVAADHGHLCVQKPKNGSPCDAVMKGPIRCSCRGTCLWSGVTGAVALSVSLFLCCVANVQKPLLFTFLPTQTDDTC